MSTGIEVDERNRSAEIAVARELKLDAELAADAVGDDAGWQFRGEYRRVENREQVGELADSDAARKKEENEDRRRRSISQPGDRLHNR